MFDPGEDRCAVDTSQSCFQSCVLCHITFRSSMCFFIVFGLKLNVIFVLAKLQRGGTVNIDENRISVSTHRSTGLL